MKRLFHPHKIIAVLMTSVYLSTHCVFGYSMELAALSRPPSVPAPLASLVSVPVEFGSLRGARTGNSGTQKTVIHIQDVHRNLEAQSNISQTIQSLLKDHPAAILALEGAFAPINLRPFRLFPDQTVVRQAADSLLERNEISGSLHAALVTLPAVVVGVDDRVHHAANVTAVREGLAQVPSVRALLARRQQQLLAHTNTTWSLQLRQWHRIVRSYREGRLPLGAYVSELSARHPALPVSCLMYLACVNTERTLDFNTADAERRALLAELSRRLTFADRQNLLEMSVRCQTGGLRIDEFYSTVRRLCERYDVSIDQYPSFLRYVTYVAASSRIDAAALFSDLRDAERRVYSKFTRTAREQELIAQDRQLFLATKLVEFSLSSEEWNEYQHGRRVALPPAFESFYLEAQRRDVAMADNLTRAMITSGADTAILITGGFHSEGIEQRLKAKGISTVVVVPRLTHVDTDHGTSYLNTFAEEKTPLDKVFSGEKLFLEREQATNAQLRRIALETVSTAVFAAGQRPNKRLSALTRPFDAYFDFPGLRGFTKDGTLLFSGRITGPDQVRRAMEIQVTRTSDSSKPYHMAVVKKTALISLVVGAVVFSIYVCLSHVCPIAIPSIDLTKLQKTKILGGLFLFFAGTFFSSLAFSDLSNAQRPLTILFIEDNNNHRLPTSLRLRSMGHDVIEARTISEATMLFEANKDRIDLILTDQNVPAGDGFQDGDGFEFARQAVQGRSIPIVLTTGWSDPQLAPKEFILQKPFIFSQLINVILEACSSLGSHELEASDSEPPSSVDVTRYMDGLGKTLHQVRPLIGGIRSAIEDSYSIHHMTVSLPDLDLSDIQNSCDTLMKALGSWAGVAKYPNQEQYAQLLRQQEAAVQKELERFSVIVERYSTVLENQFAADTNSIRKTVELIFLAIVNQIQTQGQFDSLGTPQMTNINNLVSVVLPLLRSQYKGDLLIDARFDADPLQVSIDPYLLTLILQNPVRNAFEAVVNAGMSGVRMEFVTSRVDNEIELLVRDEGPGINGVVLDRLNRGESLTTKREGQGIGVSLLKEIIEKAGGRLEIISRVRSKNPLVHWYLQFVSNLKTHSDRAYHGTTIQIRFPVLASVSEEKSTVALKPAAKDYMWVAAVGFGEEVLRFLIQEGLTLALMGRLGLASFESSDNLFLIGVVVLLRVGLVFLYALVFANTMHRQIRVGMQRVSVPMRLFGWAPERLALFWVAALAGLAALVPHFTLLTLTLGGVDVSWEQAAISVLVINGLIALAHSAVAIHALRENKVVPNMSFQRSASKLSPRRQRLKEVLNAIKFRAGQKGVDDSENRVARSLVQSAFYVVTEGRRGLPISTSDLVASSLDVEHFPYRTSAPASWMRLPQKIAAEILRLQNQGEINDDVAQTLAATTFEWLQSERPVAMARNATSQIVPNGPATTILSSVERDHSESSRLMKLTVVSAIVFLAIVGIWQWAPRINVPVLFSALPLAMGSLMVLFAVDVNKSSGLLHNPALVVRYLTSGDDQLLWDEAFIALLTFNRDEQAAIMTSLSAEEDKSALDRVSRLLLSAELAIRKNLEVIPSQYRGRLFNQAQEFHPEKLPVEVAEIVLKQAQVVSFENFFLPLNSGRMRFRIQPKAETWIRTGNGIYRVLLEPDDLNQPLKVMRVMFLGGNFREATGEETQAYLVKGTLGAVYEVTNGKPVTNELTPVGMTVAAYQVDDRYELEIDGQMKDDALVIAPIEVAVSVHLNAIDESHVVKVSADETVVISADDLKLMITSTGKDCQFSPQIVSQSQSYPPFLLSDLPREGRVLGRDAYSKLKKTTSRKSVTIVPLWDGKFRVIRIGGNRVSVRWMYPSAPRVESASGTYHPAEKNIPVANNLTSPMTGIITSRGIVATQLGGVTVAAHATIRGLLDNLSVQLRGRDYFDNNDWAYLVADVVHAYSSQSKPVSNEDKHLFGELAILICKAFQKRVDLVVDRDDFADALQFVKGLQQVISTIPRVLKGKTSKPFIFNIGKISDPNLFGFTRFKSQAEIVLGMTQMGRSELDVRRTFWHEWMHAMLVAKNAKGTDLVFPVADWKKALALMGYTHATVQGKRIPLSLLLDVDQWGLDTVRLYICGLRGAAFSASDAPPEEKYFRDPHEILVHSIVEGTAGPFIDDEVRLDLVELAETNMLREHGANGDIICHFNTETASFHVREAPSTFASFSVWPVFAGSLSLTVAALVLRYICLKFISKNQPENEPRRMSRRGRPTRLLGYLETLRSA